MDDPSPPSDPSDPSRPPDVALDRPRRVHVVGVGGAGMSAIATVLAAMGHRVSGSDLRDSPNLARLRAAGVTCAVGHDAANVPADVDLVTRSTAIADTNPEVRRAGELGLVVASRADVLAAICATRRTIAVAGTHGKTTTSSMLALVLRDAGMRPSFIIGGDVNEIGTGAVWDDTGDWFVVEADESDGTFLRLPRAAAIVTNVEPDHLEHYGGWAPLRDAFERFVAETPGPVVMSADDAGAAALGAAARALGADVVTYGSAAGSDHHLGPVGVDRTGCRFTFTSRTGERAEVHLPVPGRHNAANAAGALALALELGAPLAAGVDALARFGGVARRFEFRGEAGGITFVDDYAHLPTEVRAALAAARSGGWDRVVCVFQPHRYSRTAALWADFAEAFDDADVLVVTDVYASGEAPRPGVTGELLLGAVLEARPGRAAAYCAHRDELRAHLLDELVPGDLCLTLGAGDLTTLPDELLAALQSPGP